MRVAAFAAAVAAACLTSATATASHPIAGRPGSLGVKGMDEAKLRRFEAKVLGPEHAAEHARERASIKRMARAHKAPTAKTGTSAAGPSQSLSAAQAAAVSSDPAVSGRWNAPFSIPVMGIHAALLPTGKVMWWAYPQNPTPPYGDPSFPNTAQAWLYDPGTGATKRVDPPLWRDPADGQLKPANIWCSGESFLADGRLLITGGNLGYQGAGGYQNYAGLNKVYTFNPFNETWTEQPDMPKGRWYPSQQRLADGRTIIMAGLDESGAAYSTNKLVEIFTPSANMDGRGTLTTLGSRGGAGQPPDGGLYPHLFSMPSGRMLVTGPDLNDTWALNDPGSSNTYSWSDLPSFSRRRLWGSAVLRPGGTGGSTKVTLLGGSQPDYSTSPPSSAGGVASTETYDEANPGAGWQPGAPMNIGRSHLNTVLLPDSSMVTVGGGIGTRPPEGQWAADPEQRQVELYDPTSNTWSLGAAQAESRAYHSTALLLPDGRVLSAGDDLNGGTDRDTAEIYEPPYLFKGTRPRITQAPASVATGETFDVDAADAPIQKAVLVAPSSVTHANDFNQRVIPLALSQRTGGVRLTAPAAPNVATPGYYMLFLLSDQGVPSVAKFVKLTPGAAAPPSGQVAAYSFNEGQGSSVADASGTGNGGTLNGATWTTGKNGGGLNFDGVNDTVNVPDANSLDLTGPMTLSAWIKPRTVTNWRTVILKERTNGLAYALYGSTDTNKPDVEVGTNGTLYGPSQLPANSWSHLAATYDGATIKIYVNGTQVASKAQAITMPVSASPLRIGGNSIWSEFFDGVIDDVRVYSRALGASEIQTDRDTPVGGTPPPPPPDTTPPTVNVTAPAAGATVSGSSVALTANASDDVGVTGVQFKVDGTDVGSEDTTSPYGATWNTTGLSDGSHDITAVARDAAGHSTTSTKVTVTVQNTTPDTSPPSVNVTAPAAGSTVSGSSVALTANASDDVGVTGVQFKVDGTNVGSEDTSSPYSATWNTTPLADGPHDITAVARDAAGHSTTSAKVTVTVQNTVPGPNGLVAAYSLNEGVGAVALDASNQKNTGTVSGPGWTTGKNGGGLSFDGVNDLVTIPDSNSLDLTNGMTLEAWVKPTVVTSWRQAILKERLSNLCYALYASTDTNRPNTEVGTAGTLYGPTSLTANSWAHIASTYNGSTVRLYVNGTQVATRSYTALMPTSTGALRLGGNTVWSEWFAGVMDDVRVYNRALSAAEIATDRDTPVPNGSL